MVRQYQGSVAKIISTSGSWGTKRGPLGFLQFPLVLASSMVELV